MGIKISVIGAGSAVFSLNLVRDVCITPNMKGSTVSLMDIDEERLMDVYELCKRYAEEAKIKLRIEKTTDRKVSLHNADFVINTALTAGNERLKEGWNIAKELGYRFGGSYHIFHDEAFWINYYQIRFHESVLKDILAICPNAWYLLVANPVMASVTYLKRKYPHAKLIGVCHGYKGVYDLAQELGLDKNSITFELPGVNHFIWLTHFHYKGENAFEIVDRWIAGKGENFWEVIPWKYGLGPKAFDLYKRFGAFPIGDTCTPGGGSWPYWYHSSESVERKWKEDTNGWWNWYFRYLKDEVIKIRRTIEDPSIKLMDVFPPELSGEPMIPFIESIAFDIPRILIVNTLNTGNFVSGIPHDFEVEIPALVSKRGVQGINTYSLPRTLTSHILRDRIAPVEIELEAFEMRDRNRILDLIMMDPWTKSEEQARELLSRIFALPYHDELREHYR